MKKTLLVALLALITLAGFTATATAVEPVAVSSNPLTATLLYSIKISDTGAQDMTMSLKLKDTSTGKFSYKTMRCAMNDGSISKQLECDLLQGVVLTPYESRISNGYLHYRVELAEINQWAAAQGKDFVGLTPLNVTNSGYARITGWRWSDKYFTCEPSASDTMSCMTACGDHDYGEISATPLAPGAEGGLCVLTCICMSNGLPAGKGFEGIADELGPEL